MKKDALLPKPLSCSLKLGTLPDMPRDPECLKAA